MSREAPEGTAIAILVTTRPCLQFEWTLVQKFDQPLGRPVTESKFRGAFGLADLGCIDVGDPDFRASDPQRVAIDNAGGSMAAGAFFKLYRSHMRCGQRHRWSIDRQGSGACEARDHREDRAIALPSLFPDEKPEIMRICQTSNAPVSSSSMYGIEPEAARDRRPSVTGCRRGDPVSAASLLSKKIEEGSDSVSLSGKMLDLHLAVCSDPTPTACQADLAEQVGLDRHSIEPSHVAGFVRAFDVKLVGLNEHGSIIARPPIFVQREM
ncbi:hypothetical protein J2T08_006075 [Neorhizobium galegae]|nr:hypothetical protein [Neorhizobium galegae]MDQ0138130.1 hypothetical protein [Neorhizobium galegae]